jgi:hypothetical protein
VGLSGTVDAFTQFGAFHQFLANATTCADLQKSDPLLNPQYSKEKSFESKLARFLHTH